MLSILLAKYYHDICKVVWIEERNDDPPTIPDGSWPAPGIDTSDAWAKGCPLKLVLAGSVSWTGWVSMATMWVSTAPLLVVGRASGSGFGESNKHNKKVTFNLCASSFTDVNSEQKQV